MTDNDPTMKNYEYFRPIYNANPNYEFYKAFVGQGIMQEAIIIARDKREMKDRFYLSFNVSNNIANHIGQDEAIKMFCNLDNWQSIEKIKRGS